MNRINELRKEKKLTWDELANQLNISKTVIWMMGNGEREIKGTTLMKISSFFKVSADYLLGLSEIRNPVEELKRVVESNNAYDEIDIPELLGLFDKIKDMPKDELSDLAEYVDFKLSKLRNKEK